MNDQLYEVELVKSEVKQKEPNIVGFLFPQYEKLRMLELFYNFCDKNCDVTKFEELETDIDSLYLASSKKDLCDCFCDQQGNRSGTFPSGECTDEFSASSILIFFLRT